MPLGAYLSFFVNGSTGGVIVVLQAIIFCVIFLFAPKHGFIKAYKLRKHIVRPSNNA